jgi:PAS domain S-box-containing protein
MKTNLPVTQHEVLLQDEDVIITKTDLKGVITYANHDFVRISGFSSEELIGKNHNLIRHPDMPAEAFADMWATLKQGKPWSGYVKNRCKNGDFYWVRTEVAPVEQNGQIAGYASIRKKPDREAIKQAETLYKQLQAGTAKARLKGGLVVSTHLIHRLNPLRWLNAIKVVSQLWLLIGAFLLAIVFTGASQMMVSKPLAVGGHIYEKISMDNDLLADALPPPLYLVETYLTALRMVEAPPSTLPSLVAAAEKLNADFESRHQYWQQHLQVEELKQLESQNYKTGRAFMETLQRQLLPAVQQGDKEAARRVIATLDQLYEAHRVTVDALVSATNQNHNQIESETKSYVETSNVVLIAANALLIAVLGFLSWIVLRNVMRFGDPEYVSEIIRHIASGNLAISVERPKSPANMLYTVFQLKQGLNQLVKTATGNTGKVLIESRKVAASSDQVAALTREQSESIMTIAATAEEMTESIRNVANESSEAQAVSEQSSATCSNGVDVINNAVHSMEQIAATVREASVAIGSLDVESEKISTVVSVIREIADQTNLLALNAAIEAARAGEQGRGFAVVADEVRKLAERTTTATEEIATMITTIQTGMQHAVGSMEHGVQQVDKGVGLASEAGEAIGHIKESAGQVSQIVSAISAALQEQRTASLSVAQHIERIAAMSEENSAISRENHGLARSVGEAAEHLQHTVNRFVV